MLLPDNIADRDSIMWMTVEAWDRLIVREQTIARQAELTADDYEVKALPERVEASTRWRMYE